MEEQPPQQDPLNALLSEFATRLNEIEEKQRIVKDRILLTGNNLVSTKEEYEKEFLGLKKQTSDINEEIRLINQLNKRIINELGNLARKTEVEILQRQMKIFEPLKFARIEDIKRIVEEALKTKSPTKSKEEIIKKIEKEQISEPELKPLTLELETKKRTRTPKTKRKQQITRKTRKKHPKKKTTKTIKKTIEKTPKTKSKTTKKHPRKKPAKTTRKTRKKTTKTIKKTIEKTPKTKSKTTKKHPRKKPAKTTRKTRKKHPKKKTTKKTKKQNYKKERIP